VESARYYVDQIKMSERPEFYSGRGPNPGDLDGRMIAKMHERILLDGGKAPAEAFVAMVASLKNAAATTFLLGLYELEARDWVWPETARVERGFDLGPDDEGREAVGFATIAEAFHRSSRGDANADYMIRGEFLLEHDYTYEEKTSRWRKLKKGETQRRPRSAFGSYWGG